jgi:hypothetical protein
MTDTMGAFIPDIKNFLQANYEDITIELSEEA